MSFAVLQALPGNAWAIDRRPFPCTFASLCCVFFKSLLQSCFIVRGGYFPLLFPPLNTSALYLRVASSCALLCGKSHALKINGYVDMSPGKQPSMTSCWSWQPCALGGGGPQT